LESITRAQELHDWFGYWPDFHDAVIIKFHFSLREPSHLVIHTWEMTRQVDAKGCYELTKHIMVEFVLEDISTLNLADPWNRSILLGLLVDKTETGFRLALSSSYGLSGTIEARRVSVQVKPGKPSV
jgi:hypothetical protein